MAGENILAYLPFIFGAILGVMLVILVDLVRIDSKLKRLLGDEEKNEK